MSKKLYAINKDTFEIEEHDYKTTIKHYKEIFGNNFIEDRNDKFFLPYCAETEYYFSRKHAVSEANLQLKDFVTNNKIMMDSLIDRYFAARTNVSKFSGKVIK